MATTEDIKKAKALLLTTLSDNFFDTKNEAVIQAVENLSTLWMENINSTEAAPLYNSELIYGNWKMISAPFFPGRIINEEEPDKYQYTLGRMAFNMFEPRDALVTICHKETYNMVHKIETPNKPLEEDSKEEQKASYNILTKLIIHTSGGGELPAELLVEGFCTPESDTKMTVAFNAGTLRKRAEVTNDETLSKLWDETFKDVYAKADQERSYFEMFTRWLMKKLMKMTFPSDESMRYEMNASKGGAHDILYADEDLRVTKGHRGSVIIVGKEKE